MTTQADSFSNKLRSASIETSGRQGSIALALGAELLVEFPLSSAQRHAVELMPALQRLCQQQGWQSSKLEHLYLSLGPGSFTGLRIAVAIARTLSQAIGCKLVGVPSLDVIAENAPQEFPVVIPILDAKRNQIFAARYERQSTGELLRTAGPALVDPKDFLSEAVTRANGGKVAILGEGIDYHRDAIRAADPTQSQITELEKPLWIARAATVHKLGWQKAQRNEFADPQTLLPIYIRLPEAEEVYRKKHNLPLT
jgi:tRNA threonylcarbamoyladenosine biosynthesis protein TsaB